MKGFSILSLMFITFLRGRKEGGGLRPAAFSHGVRKPKRVYAGQVHQHPP